MYKNIQLKQKYNYKNVSKYLNKLIDLNKHRITDAHNQTVRLTSDK